MNINELLQLAVAQQASDLHLAAEQPPLLRIAGLLQPCTVQPILSASDLQTLLYAIMNERQRLQLAEQLDLDFAYELTNLARFRVNIFHQQQGLAAVFRVIPTGLRSLMDLGLPDIVTTLCAYPRGLILVTGPTGSGKSTTLAAMVDQINQHRQQHIITIEDPIEFIHASKNCLVNQREVHQHALSFEQALRSALREDPDVLLIGELRDLETIRLALTAAETGHLVLATLHTLSCAKTVHRIIDAFPGDEKNSIRAMLAESLQAVISQLLLPKIGGGRIAAQEIMVCNTAIRNLIREDKIPQIYSVMQTGSAQGMQLLDQHLQKLVLMGQISAETAQLYSHTLLKGTA